MGSGVTIIIPHIPVRERELERALASVRVQTVQADAVLVMTDQHHNGSAAMRNDALPLVETKWVAFLDDDDELMPNHIETLVSRVIDFPGVDVFYPGCRVYGPEGREIPRRMEWGRFLQPFDAQLLREKSYIPVTSMVRTSLAQQALFGAPEGSYYDDWGFYVRLLDLGATFQHVPKITWKWHHHGKNTQGRADMW